jgi:hypothetical protein
MPRWRSSSLSHQCPECCTGPVPPSLSQPTGGRSIAAAFETAAFSGRLDISPAALRTAPLQSRQGFLPKAVRPVRLSLAAAGPADRPPAVLTLHMEGQDCMRDMSVAPFGSSVRAPVHRRHKPCREWCRSGWLQLPLLHRGGVRTPPWSLPAWSPPDSSSRPERQMPQNHKPTAEGSA